ncbi:MAG: protocadherin [Planctomycetes bacterium]|nr:protocadherin [Planctomycetota bacterium]
MKHAFSCMLIVGLVCLLDSDHADGWGHGGRGGGGWGGGGWRGGGGYHADSWGGARSDSWGDRSYSGWRSGNSYSGWRGAGATSSYDRSWTDARGGSVNVDGTRGAAVGPRGGAVAGGTRDVTATTAGGRTYNSDKQAGVAVGPHGRVVGGSERTGVATGPGGAVSRSSGTAFAGSRFSTDFGLAHYSSISAAGVHSTAYWSHGVVTTRAGYVRTNFGYYNCFHPAWYTAHPGCWFASGWAAGAAWTAATWPVLSTWCAIPAQPVYYDYGNTIVYQNNNVYVDGQDAGTAQAYAKQAAVLADQGQQAKAPPEEEWKALGVFALVQGEEKTSNNIFQIAVNKAGIIRGNYYDGVMDTTSPIYGSVDKKTQRAAWTIGKKNDRVFETGVYNLTKAQTPILVHLGADRTQQWLLVRVEAPSDSKESKISAMSSIASAELVDAAFTSYNPYTGGVHTGAEGYNPRTGSEAESRSYHNPYTGNTAHVQGAYSPRTGNYAYHYNVRR